MVGFLQSAKYGVHWYVYVCVWEGWSCKTVDLGVDYYLTAAGLLLTVLLQPEVNLSMDHKMPLKHTVHTREKAAPPASIPATELEERKPTVVPSSTGIS